MATESPAVEHPLFGAMVLMGSSLALGCGGTTADTAGGAGSAHGNDPRGTGGSSQGGSAGASEGAGTGGTVIIEPVGTGSGGLTSGAGGAVNSGSGGIGGDGWVTVGAAGTAGAPALACPPSQWSCKTDTFACDNFSSRWPVAGMCQCNLDRPRTAADCPPGKTFTCRAGASGNDDAIPFACTCLDASLATDCSSACQVAFPAGSDTEYGTCAPGPENQFLCGCAWVLLR